MNSLGILLVSFVPGLLWLWFIVRLDRLRPSSRKWIALTFLYGTLSTIPAALVTSFFISELYFNPITAFAAYSMSMLLVIGPVEETCKFLAIRLSVYRTLHFEESMDGLVYGAAASLGFASLENLVYVLGYGPDVMVIRAPISTLGHMVFGCMWGFGLGLYRSGRGAWVVWVGLVGAAVFHGLFNYLVFSPIPWLGYLLIVSGGIWTYKLFRWGQRISPFRYRRNIPLIHCEGCGELLRFHSKLCSACGYYHTGAFTEIICGNCKTTNRQEALYCTSCGNRLLV